MTERPLSLLALQDLGLFVEVARASSFTMASTISEIPVATLSRRIAAMEKRLGVRLFERGSRRLVLTEPGRRYWQDCEQILAAAGQAQAALQADVVQPTGRLRVSMPVEFGLEFLFPVLDSFARTYPAIEMVLDLSPRQVDFSEDAMDVAIRLGPVRDPNLVARALEGHLCRVYASTAYLAQAGEPIRPEDLSRHSCILHAHMAKPGLWRLQGPEGTLDVPVHGRFSTNNVSMMRLLAEQGHGIAMLPSKLAASAVAEQRLYRVLADWQMPLIPVHLVMSSRLQPARVRAFVEFVCKTLVMES